MADWTVRLDFDTLVELFKSIQILLTSAQNVARFLHKQRR